jgi:hypothetical protein
VKKVRGRSRTERGALGLEWGGLGAESSVDVDKYRGFVNQSTYMLTKRPLESIYMLTEFNFSPETIVNLTVSGKI